MAIELYPHNQQTYEKITDMFKTSNRVGVVQPTGTGKSFLYLKWIEDHPLDRFAILSPSTEIFTQLQEYAESSGAPELLESVEMISYQALLRMTEEEVQAVHIDKMVLDEFHRTGAEQWGPSLQRLLDANPQAQVLGASATPVRYLDDSKDMATELFDRNLAVEMTLGEAVQRKILPTPKYVPVWYDVDGTMDRYQKDISRVANFQERRELEEKMEQMKRRLENSYGAEDIFRKHIPSDHGKFLVFCRDNAHLEEMKKTLPQWLAPVNGNVRSYVSISAQEDKDLQLQAFKEDKSEDAIKILFTIDRLNEGLHVKGIDGVIMLRPTMSPIIYLQQMGRALASGGKNPLIFDLVNNYQNVQIPLQDGSSVNVFEREFRTAMDQYEDISVFRIFEDMSEFSSLFSELEDVLYPSYDYIWQKNFNLYKSYKAEFGRDPKKEDIYQGVYIGNWVGNQRYAFKKGILSENRMQQLLSCGFDFSLRDLDADWQEKFDLYKAFKAEFGREPQKEDIYKGVDFYNWVGVQRRAFKKGTLSEDRKQQLLVCGFVFNQLESGWQETFELYKAFKAEFGCEPKQKEMHQGVNLRAWCDTQRDSYRKGKLSEERKQLLLDAGFIFDPLDLIWDRNLEIYKAYKKEFGQEPQQKSIYQGVNIGTWANNQRQAFKKGILSEDRKQQLLSCGFNFTLQDLDADWQEKLDLYKDYKAEFGREPKQGDIYQGVSIGNWISYQRQAFKKGILSEDRKQQLLSCGFNFTLQDLDADWQEKLDLYKDYKAEFGQEPQQKSIYQGVNIGSWVGHQRHAFKKGTLSEDRKQQLLVCGFVFDPLESGWQETFELYKAFKAEFGREPKKGDIYQGVDISAWVGIQRKAFKKGILSEDRKQQLLGCGFVFDPLESDWQETFELYKAFKAEFGREPKQREIYQGIKLGQWVSNLRQAFKNGTFSEDRKQKLLETGFVF